MGNAGAAGRGLSRHQSINELRLHQPQGGIRVELMALWLRRFDVTQHPAGTAGHFDVYYDIPGRENVMNLLNRVVLRTPSGSVKKSSRSHSTSAKLARCRYIS